MTDTTFKREMRDSTGDTFEVEALRGAVHVESEIDSDDGVCANLMFTPEGAMDLARALITAAGTAKAQGPG